MEALYLLVPLSILVVFLAIWVFFGASDNGQFDDLVGPGWRILQDDDSSVAAPTPAVADPEAPENTGTPHAPTRGSNQTHARLPDSPD